MQELLIGSAKPKDLLIRLFLLVLQKGKMNIEITKITSKGQLVIPLGIRQRQKISEGEKFLVYDTDDSIILKRVKNFEKVKVFL